MVIGGIEVMISKEEFNTLYARFHFNIDKDSEWEKLKVYTKYVNQIKEIVEWESGRLYDELIKLDALK